jgi:hypothetical protein
LELPSSLAALWRLSHNGDSQAAREADHRAAGVVSICFVLVACYVLVDSWDALWRHHPPAISVAGIVLAILSVGIHPWLAIRKKTIATQLHSLALTSESRQTLLWTWWPSNAPGTCALELGTVFPRFNETCKPWTVFGTGMDHRNVAPVGR